MNPDKRKKVFWLLVCCAFFIRCAPLILFPLWMEWACPPPPPDFKKFIQEQAAKRHQLRLRSEMNRLLELELSLKQRELEAKFLELKKLLEQDPTLSDAQLKQLIGFYFPAATQELGSITKFAAALKKGPLGSAEGRREGGRGGGGAVTMTKSGKAALYSIPTPAELKWREVKPQVQTVPAEEARPFPEQRVISESYEGQSHFETYRGEYRPQPTEGVLFSLIWGLFELIAAIVRFVMDYKEVVIAAMIVAGLIILGGIVLDFMFKKGRG